MRPIAIISTNNEELGQQVKTIQVNAFRDGVDEAIKILKMARTTEEFLGNKTTVKVIDTLIDTLPILYDNIGSMPKDKDSVYDRYELHKNDQPSLINKESVNRVGVADD